jgi:ferredoxin
MAKTPDPRNAVGDYYVERDCCTLCGVPWHVAPELFGYDDSGCWVARQPASRAEEAKMVEVFARQELGCIRYRGRDSRVLHALQGVGEQRQCDPSHRNSPAFAHRLVAQEEAAVSTETRGPSNEPLERSGANRCCKGNRRCAGRSAIR